MNGRLAKIAFLLALVAPATCYADLALIQQHCAKCHTGPKPKGDFSLHELRNAPDERNADYWISSLEYVRAGDMPPAKHNRLSPEQRERLIDFLQGHVGLYEEHLQRPTQVPPRRLNNREFINSLRDVLMIEDVGTHQPAAMLLGDTLKDGFDTDGEALGMSGYHLDQYVTAVRKILEATILTEPKPPTKIYEVPADLLRVTDNSHRRRPEKANRTSESIDLLDLRLRAYFANFESVPATGRYRITLRATAVDRHVYDQEETGIYDHDSLQLRVHLGDRIKDFDLPENDVMEIELDEWLAKGTRVQFSYPTDGLRLKGNGNFKFQNRIAHDYIQKNDPELYQRVIKEEVPKARYRSDQPGHWSHWVPYWQGPRPRLFSAKVEGPLYESWPPKRQIALLGRNPSVKNAVAILRPIAQRAWRRNVTEDELAPIVRLVQSQSETLSDVAALREGILAILVSPSFLMINPEETSPQDRWATKFSYLFASTTPDADLIAKVREGKLQSLEAIRQEVQRHIANGRADEFLSEFPYAWLQLDRINFMAPDPDRFPLYEKKRISEDMVREVLHFFRYAVQHNRPVPELLTADYSFVNADLAKIYRLNDVPSDSKLRKYNFQDGRRGGFLGMGAFLTLTADSLSTSPVHRAIYVMENFMGIHPSPPPADVPIEEPDIRSAKTIREVLQAHRSDATCASRHQSIDPFGYAFENFDPVGAWRDFYENPEGDHSEEEGKRAAKRAIPIDASATFLSGTRYRDISEFRKLLKEDASRDRFVRCFVTKLLTYANGVAPENYSAIEAIVHQSAEHDYRIVETIAAVIDSPLFREQ